SAQLGARWARRDPPPAAMLEQTLRTIDAAASRLNRILDTIMDSARIARGVLAPQRAETDLGALTREVVRHHQAQTHRHRIVLHAPRRRITGEWDEALLERAVENLVGNAVKYSPEGGRIDVTCAREGQLARLSVRDQGVGIPADALPHLFTRFYRARNVAMGEIEGNGLGLFTVKGIVEAHGGRVEVWSEEGVGTEVTVWLPLHTQGEQA
ncbi:MAG TPA: sensor histidine kinase, partial [Dehalococcoidia bacterium]|nr:sensor histidine kinase [Dehalococcoidia bacterium]